MESENLPFLASSTYKRTSKSLLSIILEQSSSKACIEMGGGEPNGKDVSVEAKYQ
jgi:hypothetical protein